MAEDVSVISFSGIISTVTPDGRSAIVTITGGGGRFSHAIIREDTEGRIALMNLCSGELKKGIWVQGIGTPGADALISKEIRPAQRPDAQAAFPPPLSPA